MYFRIDLLVCILTMLITSENDNFNKQEFYMTLSSTSLEKIDITLNKLNKHVSTSQIRAYTGALMIKKSNFVKIINDKLELFKQGKSLLEKEIEDSPTNIEYRFIRLSIQEHIPEILNYNNNIMEDKKIIVLKYTTLDKELQTIIMNYAKQSKIITSLDLKF